eukprot:6365341-Prymnesium_polylepis.4
MVHHPPSVLLPVYQSLLSAILLQSGHVRSVGRLELQNMMIRISQSTRAAIVPSDDLGRLFMQLGVPLSATLYLKPSVIAWLTSTSSLPEDVVSFHLGFYVAPISHIFQMIKGDDQLPPFCEKRQARARPELSSRPQERQAASGGEARPDDHSGAAR